MMKKKSVLLLFSIFLLETSLSTGAFCNYFPKNFLRNLSSKNRIISRSFRMSHRSERPSNIHLRKRPMLTRALSNSSHVTNDHIKAFNSKIIIPSKLRPGDKIAAITSSWGGPALFPHRYELGIERLERMFDLRVLPTRNSLCDPKWIYENPKARAEDLMEAFADPSIKGIFSTIGGDDSIRLLPYIDYNIIRDNPKIFLGYSDATVTHFICAKAGLRSYYGPCIMTGFAENMDMHKYTIEGLKRTLFSNEIIGIIPENQDGWVTEHPNWGEINNLQIRRKLFEPLPWRFIGESKKSSGQLIGGCVEVLQFLIGTELWPELQSWKNAVLFLELSDEYHSPIILERFLRNLGSQKILGQINGLLFSKPGGVKAETFVNYDNAILKVLSEFHANHVSVVTNMDFGHTDPIWTLPYGAMVEIDKENRSVKILESGVNAENSYPTFNLSHRHN